MNKTKQQTINKEAVLPYENDPVICLKNVTVVYGRYVAIYNIDLDIYKGEFIGICGPNGSGKTTLFKTIIGLLKPITGQIHLFGTKIDNNIPKEFRYKIGYVPQFQPFDRNFPALVNDVVEMGRYGRAGIGKPLTKKDKEIVLEAMEKVGIEKLAERPIGHLSGGQQQKVLIAQALATEAEILLLDEPTSALDFKMTEELMKLLERLNQEYNITILTINHNMELLQEFSHRIICLNKAIAYDGPPRTEQLNKTIQTIFYT